MKRHVTLVIALLLVAAGVKSQTIKNAKAVKDMLSSNADAVKSTLHSKVIQIAIIKN